MPQPIHAKQRKLLEHTEMSRADGQKQQIHHHQAANEQVHVVPMIIIHQIGRKQVGQLHAPQNDDVQQGEEHREVPRRRHPELDVGHAFERTLYLAYALDETYQPKQGQECNAGRKQIAQQDTRSRRTQ